MFFFIPMYSWLKKNTKYRIKKFLLCNLAEYCFINSNVFIFNYDKNVQTI